MLLAAVALAAGVAYWSDHYRLPGWEATPPSEGPFPHQPPQPPARAPAVAPAGPERLEVHATADPAGKAALCAELREVIQGIDAALLNPQSPASAEQLTARRRVYVDQRIALGC